MTVSSDLVGSSLFNFYFKVSSEMVTEEAWQVLLPHLATGVAIKLDLENVFDVLRAANFLQMDEAEIVITDFIKAHISKTDFLDAYNFAKQAKIDGLANTIRTTLVQPEEVRSHILTMSLLKIFTCSM